jgi:hypothetical protein
MMKKKYNFTAYEDIPEDLIDYVLTISNEIKITNLTLKEINEFLNEVDAHLSDEWVWQDSGIELGF